MRRIKTKSKTVAQISTASLPDIVFLLLFFFMVSAVIRTEKEIQQISLPKASQLTKAEMKILIKEIKVGFPLDENLGQEPTISANGRFIKVDQLPQWVLNQKATLPESMRDQVIILIKADEMVKMGLVADIQQQLRKANARKVLYRSIEKSNKVL